uniref:Cadherin domain-containing protein n=1 Tax=Wuchereria bancrofti TaxID=6293 RepID=A0AAF5PYR1_WUCBA
MRGNVMLTGGTTLEDGEIEDDDDLDVIHRNTSMEIKSENMTHVSSVSVDEEREREVDRIIREVQEATDRSEFMSLPSAEHSIENVDSDDEDALRLAVLNTSKDKRSVRQHLSHEAEEGEIIDTSYMPSRSQQLNMRSSSRQTWVQLKRKQNNKFQSYGDMQNRIKNRKFHQTVIPLKVTVRNDSTNGYSYCILNNQQKATVSTNNNEEILEAPMKQFSNPFEDQLHRLRLRVEASKFSKRMENLGDNYEQVGMDIVDSDRDSRSRSSPASPLVNTMAVRSHEMQARSGISPDGADNEEDVDQLRAELLEQIMHRKNYKKLTLWKPSPEEGELSSANSEEQSALGSNEKPSSSCRTETHYSKRFANVVEQNRKPEVNRKRSRKDDSLSSGSDDGQVQDYRIKLSRKRKENFRETIPKKSRWKSKEFGSISGIELRKTENWQHMIDVEKKVLKEIERKLRHRDDQKCVTRRKRDNFLERANRCARRLGVLEAEIEVLRCDQEKAKGRLSYLERQLNKEQFEENSKDVEKKTFGKKEGRRIERLIDEAESRKNINIDIGHAYDPTEIVVKSENGAEGLRTIKTCVLEHSEPMSTTITMDCSDDRDDVSRPTSSSSSGSQHSSIDILGDSDIIELSDSTDSMNGLITAMRELEQEELEANYITEATTANSSTVYQGSPEPERTISRTVTLSEKDVNELKNNPLIMFNGYRICPTFPYRMIAHRALSNKLDPLKPLCYYELLGRCVDPTCPMQHEKDYLLTDEELICSVLTYCPNLCPPKKMFSEYAREMLKEHEAESVGEIIENMLKSLPDTERRIRVCEMATKCRLPARWSSKDDESIEYEVPQQSHQFSL